jgi:hypothetical protein
MLVPNTVSRGRSPSVGIQQSVGGAPCGKTARESEGLTSTVCQGGSLSREIGETFRWDVLIVRPANFAILKEIE